MEKKRLGRGLNEISETFLSKVEHKDVGEHKEILLELSSIIEQEENCNYCINLNNSFPDPKCNIFTFQNEKYAVPYLEKINPTQGKYCKYFKHIPLQSTNGLSINKNTIPELTDTECEVEETTRIDRKIAYTNAKNSQKFIKKSLVEHLKEGYMIKSCVLRKIENVSTIGKNESREVEVTIYTELI